MSQEVLRRFEVHAAGPGPLDKVKSALQEADGQRQVRLLAPLNVVKEPPFLPVRLTGDVKKVAGLMDQIRAMDVQIVRDFVDAPSNGEPGKIFPDPRPLLRINVAPRGLDEPPRHPVGDPRPPSERRAVKVAIVDSGIMLDHVDLKPNLQVREPSKGCFIGGSTDNSVTDEDGHGTMLAGTILSIANLGPAIEIIPIKFFDASTRPVAEK